MLDRSEQRRWREAARDAQRAAEVQVEAALHHWACFLAEQAARLGVKGVLHGIGAGAWGHDLVTLGARLADSTGEPTPDEAAAALRRLSRHYIPARYPDAHPSGPPGAYYGVEDAEQALRDLDLLLAWLDDLWARLSILAG